MARLSRSSPTCLQPREYPYPARSGIAPGFALVTASFLNAQMSRHWLGNRRPPLESRVS